MLRTEWYCAAALALAVLGCKPSSLLPASEGGDDPKVRATVVTVRTALQPSNETSAHSIVIGSEMARDTSEVQRWRLFDFKRNRVLFVDDVEKTYRAVPLPTLVSRLPENPDAELTTTPERRAILGVQAGKSVIRRGAYQREVWLAEHPAIPPQLFAMMEASEGRPSLLLEARGFPFVDHAEVPYGTGKLVADRTVVSVASREVPASLLQIPPGYREITAPAAGPRSASSGPRDQRAPAAGSPPSSTTQTTP